jgi:hypothetical protein
MAIFLQTVSGHAVIPAWGGPENFQNVGGRSWTDQQGFGQDDGKHFRIRGGRNVDFYVPLTNPAIAEDVRLQANYAGVTFEVIGPAFMTSFQVWDRTTMVFMSPPLVVAGNHRIIWAENQNAFALTADMPVQGNLSIKVSFLAPGDADVIFTGAGIRFHN